jgi:ABC-type Fe3+-hydroxamate transport system substrate-binding protein
MGAGLNKGRIAARGETPSAMIASVEDQMGRAVQVSDRPQRIISLVPSQTELLYDLGLGERVVGITKFCVHPEIWFKSKHRVGGTKKVDMDKVRALKPDLIIGNKEENERKDIQALEQEFPVWMSDIRDLPGDAGHDHPYG